MKNNKALSIGSGVALSLVMAVCAADELPYLGGDVRGYNHTSSSINSFSVNDYGGGRARPYGESGAVCCAMLPKEWRPGLMLEVAWEADPDPYVDLPPFGTDAFRAFMVEHKKNYRQLSAMVELPPYDDEVCGLEVHFMPCDKIKLSTSCWGYPSPNSPIKEPLEMSEPAVCAP